MPAAADGIDESQEMATGNVQTRLFSGTPDADARGEALHGPGEKAWADRERQAAELRKQREREAAELEAQHNQEIADLEAEHRRENDELQARRRQDVEDLAARVDNEAGFDAADVDAADGKEQH